MMERRIYENFNHHPTQHHDSVLLHFSREKQTLQGKAIKMIKIYSKSLEYGYSNLSSGSTIGDFIVWVTIT